MRFEQHESRSKADDQKRDQNAFDGLFQVLVIAGEIIGQHDYDGELCQLGRLYGSEPKIEPALFHTVARPDQQHENEQYDCNAIEQP